MNYMLELVEFDRWTDRESPGAHAISLWFALMRICNRAGWKNPFTAAVSVLMQKSGLSRSGVYRAREELKALGRIVFTEHGGRRCAEYYIVPFEEASRVVSPVVSHVASQIDIDFETILKQNKTKEERITPIPPQGDWVR